MENVKTITITEIENISETEAAAVAIDRETVKGYNVYYIDLGGAFGFSYVVFADGQQIKYANDYELHHPGKTREELREYYGRAIRAKLFTAEEIKSPLKTYSEYQAKIRYLRDLYGLRREYVSIFCINPTEAQQKEFERETKEKIYNPVCFAYMSDADFVKHHVELLMALEKQFADTVNNYEYQKNAFIYELGNHEYHINDYQGDYDTLSAFGGIEWHGQGREAREKYYAELNFTETQKKAFEDARREFLRMAEEKGWY